LVGLALVSNVTGSVFPSVVALVRGHVRNYDLAGPQLGPPGFSPLRPHPDNGKLKRPFPPSFLLSLDDFPAKHCSYFPPTRLKTKEKKSIENPGKGYGGRV